MSINEEGFVKQKKHQNQNHKKTTLTEEVNDHIKHDPDTVSNYLRNERAMTAQRKQMNARSLLNSAFKLFCSHIIKDVV